MKRIHFTLADALFATLVCVTWCLVALDLLAGERTAVGLIAALWLGAQAVGLGVQRLGLGIDERWFWALFADQPGGAMDSVVRRYAARVTHGLLTHFSLMRIPQGLRARAIVTKSERARKIEHAIPTHTDPPGNDHGRGTLLAQGDSIMTGMLLALSILLADSTWMLRRMTESRRTQ